MNWPDRIKNSAIIWVFPFIALTLALFARETSHAARSALYLCLDVVIPSLFPFFVLSRLTVPFLKNLKCPKFIKILVEKLFGLPYYAIVIMVLGYLSGYPTGAKLARDMFDEGLIDNNQASKIIAVANNSSPLFLVGTIGAGLFRSVKIGFFLLMVHWLSGIIAGFIILSLSGNNDLKDRKSRKGFFEQNLKTGENPHIFYMIPAAVEDAAILSIKVSGYIILFAVVSELLSRTGFFAAIGSFASLLMTGKPARNWINGLFSALFRGLLEITTGAQAISRLDNCSLSIKLALVSFICGFAGFSVHTQIMGIMKGTKARYSVLVCGKLLHGALAFVLTLLIAKISPFTIQVSNAAVLSLTDFSGIRIVTVSVLILSLLFAPYRSEKTTG